MWTLFPGELSLPRLARSLAYRKPLRLRRTTFVADILPLFDCIILGPGPGTPHSDEDFCWAKRLITGYGDKIPILGICLGCQGLATAYGGKVSQLTRTPILTILLITGSEALGR
jgi:anthranilate/para-aminobenzoate synthase component II